jgi:hypothetical protein
LCELVGRNGMTLDLYLEVANGWRTGCCDSFYQLVNLQPWECENMTLPLGCHGELADGGRWYRAARRRLTLDSLVHSL